MRVFSTLVLSALGLGLATAGAVAGPAFTVTSVSVVGDAVTLVTPVGGGTTAGPILLQTSLGGLVTWCDDLFHEIDIGGNQSLPYTIGVITTNNDPVSPVTLTALQIREMTGLAVYGEGLYHTGATNDALAGVQLAIWSIEYPTFTYTGAGGAPVAADIALAATLPPGAAQLVALDGTQGLFTADLQPAPEPASLALLGTGLLGLALRKRRG